METVITGTLHAAENLLSGAVAFVKGIAHTTIPLNANLAHITDVPLPRSHHSLSVVKGRAYIFGGESSPGKLVDNAMNIVILPSSGVLTSDYTSIPARPTLSGGKVPPSRKGHIAVVIGDDIYIFGGESKESDNGRLWVYNTVTNTWTYLDASPGTAFPSNRTGHTAASSELPGPKDEVMYQEKAPQRPADPAKAVPEPADENSWGTMFVVGGRSTETGDLTNDAWAFDVLNRTWSALPTPPGQPREGASLALVNQRLYRVGGKGAETLASGGMEYLDLSLYFQHGEDGTTPLASGWNWEEVSYVEGEAPPPQSWPGFTIAPAGQGPYSLLAISGEAPPQSWLGLSVAPTGEFTYLEDIWTFQLSSEKTTAAAIKDTTKTSVKKETHEGRWSQGQYRYLDARGDEEKIIVGKPNRGLGLRGHFAIAKGTEVDGAVVVVWGGVGRDGKVLSDGWLISVER
ncbi:galactose oxidase [Amniculicola lignicola CBS 123094]|uniref:Galactose oxidase n=1 Tax=Amniculicola lignicola CBS 123094 TaxID=1392246 RepID=A0A6A5WIN8_9PLEO|nr:galactose oxidase [Amniculicola lignicola CBS 123094]